MNAQSYWQREPDRERRAAGPQRQARVAAEQRREAELARQGQMVTDWMRSQLAPHWTTISGQTPANRALNDRFHAKYRELKARQTGVDLEERSRG